MLSPTEHPTFRAMYERHFDHVARYCLRRLPNAEAHDAVSEVFLVAWRRIDDVPAGDGTLPWLYGVARNVVRNVERSSRRARRLAARANREPSYAGPGPEVQIVRQEEDELVAMALVQLKLEDQEVLRLRAYELLTIPEIADVLAYSEAAAKKRVSRAMDRLRKAAAITNERVPARSRSRPEGGEQ